MSYNVSIIQADRRSIIMAVRREKLFLILIFLLGSFLRLWQLTKIPPGLHYDEASFAYNAYSILKTGKDEFGSPLPINIRAFDDWRPPLYTYLTVVSFFLFGVNDFALRVPSALAGIALIVIFYFFVRDFVSQKIALLGTFLISINPTLVIFSRAAYDSNLALTFTLACFWLWWKGIKERRVTWLIASLFLAVGAILTYQASKVFLPLMTLMITLVYWKEIWQILKIRKNLLAFLLFGFIIALSVVLNFSCPEGLFRFTSISVFGQEELLKTSINRLLLNRQSNLSIFNPLANRRILFFQEILVRYLDNYNPSFLFAPKMEPSMHYIPNFGAFYWLEIIFLVVGIFALAKKLDSRKKIILAGWFFLVALPSAPLATAPYITRILPIIPVILIPISFGLREVCQRIPFLIISIYSFSFIYLLYSLFIILPVENGQVWQAGYREMVEKAWQLKDKYDKIYVSNSLERPYIFFLWFSKYEPALYQPYGAKREGSGLSPVVEFENFSFQPFTPEIFDREGNNLYIGKPEDFPKGVNVLKEIGCQEKERQDCIWLTEDSVDY